MYNILTVRGDRVALTVNPKGVEQSIILRIVISYEQQSLQDQLV